MARNDLPSPNAPNFPQRLREAVMTYLGRTGDPLDRGITLRDLIEGGFARLRPGYTAGQAAATGGALPIAPESQVEEPDLTPPPTPTGFTVSAAISHVFIEHDAPLYTQGHGHLRTRVYGKIVAQGDPLPVFADAVEITQFTGTVHAHPSNPSTQWRLWIKWESADGVLSVSPAGGTNGLEAVTGQDVSAMVAAMTGPGNPFTVLTEPTEIDGVTFPAGTYSTQAFIQDLQVTNAKIANLAVDNAKIADLSVAKLTGGEMNVGSFIQSTNYTEGASGNGWRINADGTAELQAAFIRGQLVAGQLAADSVETNTIRGGAVSKVVEYTWTWSGTSGDETFVRYLNMPFGGTVHYILVTQIFSTGLNEDDTMASDIYFNGVMLDGITGTFNAAGFPVVLITSVVVSSQGTVNFGGRLRWNNIAGGQARARALVLVTYR